MTPYWIWLIVVSCAFVVLERVSAARQNQSVFRPQIWNDLFYLAFNGHFYSVLTVGIVAIFETQTLSFLPEDWLASFGVLEGRSFAVQFITYFVIADFLQWLVHNLLHRVPILWNFHKIHHSARDMDWAVNFRFHWMELVVYKSLLYLPLLALGGDGEPLMAVFVFGTAWGHFNHANTRIKIGALGYLFNSPSMHLWHHDASDEGGKAKNFGIVLSCWDYLFRTAYWPKNKNPSRLGFPGDDSIPIDIVSQELHPLMARSPKDSEESID